jgi:FtsH-binding integral membrane protein
MFFKIRNFAKKSKLSIMNLFAQNNDMQPQYVNPEAASTLRTFMARVFTWMGVALVITAVVAYLFAANETLFNSLYTETGMSVLGWIVMLAPLGFVLLMSFGFQKLSAPVMMLLFVVFSVLMGMSMSFIFYAYNIGTIYLTFGVTAGVFGLMAILGYTTKIDLTRFGSIMMIGLVGIIIASVANWFMKSSGLDFIISIVGVLVFTGLTAYDVQKIKRIGSGVNMEDASTTKLAIYGALSLYLDFINLFLFILRIFGGRK